LRKPFPAVIACDRSRIRLLEMAVARITEIIASSPEGFREAAEEGLTRASKTVRGITGLEVVSKRVKVDRGQIVEYRVGLRIIFLLED
jgi:flavin-binding protein dodecin